MPRRAAPPRTVAPRRRRSPEEGRREIVDAAVAMLRTMPYRALTVDDLMATTRLSRPSFYRLFDGLSGVMLQITVELGARLLAPAQQLVDAPTDDFSVLLRRALEFYAHVFGEDAALIRAIKEAAAEDKRIAAEWRRIEDFATGYVLRRLEADIEAGLIAPLDAQETGWALGAMNVAYFTDRVGAGARVSPEKAVDVLHTIWMRALYGASKPRPRARARR